MMNEEGKTSSFLCVSIHNWLLTPPCNLDKITLSGFREMNKAKLKVLLAALKEVVEELESEIYSDTSSYIPPAEPSQTHHLSDYDEVFDDDVYLS